MHPRVDPRGVHRFDAVEVESLANDVDSGRTVLGQQLRPLGKERLMEHPEPQGECANCSALQHELSAMRRRLDTQMADHRRQLAALKAEHDRELAQQDAAARDLMTQVTELVAVLEG